ncbi:MAG: hypothetical protein J1F03_07210 [Oscillospiraceae bacterium]|nr:hypothetical protein [Oscillospiraceae bacterium]
MNRFYIVLIALSGGYLSAQLIAWIFSSKIFFPDAGELFTKKQDSDLWQTVFPKNMLRLIVCIFTGSVSGLLMLTAGLSGWMTMLFGVMAGILFNFLISRLFSPVYLKFHKSGLPDNSELEGLSGKVIEEILPDSFGVIEVRHGQRFYLFRAVSANERFIEKGKAVTVIYAQEDCCFVESDEHLCDVLFPLDSYPEEYFKK